MSSIKLHLTFSELELIQKSLLAGEMNQERAELTNRVTAALDRWAPIDSGYSNKQLEGWASVQWTNCRSLEEQCIRQRNKLAAELLHLRKALEQKESSK